MNSVTNGKAKGMTIYTLRTTSGREDIVADMMMSKIRAEKLEIRAIAHPAELKGYIFIEGRLGDIHRAIHGMLHIRGLMEKPVRMDEIQHFLDVKKAKIVVDESDIVEIVGGPFKGERGKIQRIDKAKDEVTVELLEASVPIPVTIATEFVKLVKRAKVRKAAEEAGPAEEKREEVGLPGADEIRRGISDRPEEAARERPEERPRGEPSIPEKATEGPEAGKTEEREEPSILERAQRKEEEFEAPETPGETERLTAPVVPREGVAGKKPGGEKPHGKRTLTRPKEPVILETEEELEAPAITQEPGKEEKPPEEAEEDPLLAELGRVEKEKRKRKAPEDLEEGE